MSHYVLQHKTHSTGSLMEFLFLERIRIKRLTRRDACINCSKTILIVGVRGDIACQ